MKPLRICAINNFFCRYIRRGVVTIMRKDEIVKFYEQLDRTLFVDGKFKEMAWMNRPLPIGFGQTISQPSLVLEMTLQLELCKDDKVLEIGTGSGYQTALLAQFSGAVYTVERICELMESAKEKLDTLGYSNIFYRAHDGSEGWEQHAPYDRIITTAAAGRFPDKLIEQLKPAGIAIAPVGPRGCQELLKIRKSKKGIINTVSLCKVTFVEMKGEYGWEKQNQSKP